MRFGALPSVSPVPSLRFRAKICGTATSHAKHICTGCPHRLPHKSAQPPSPHAANHLPQPAVMHAKAIEIAWHEDSSIWSLHLSSANRLVTAGGDKVARVWKLHDNPHTFFNSANNIIQPSPATTTQPLVDWLCDLRAHTTTVNVARFTHDGFTIATGADQGEIVLWRLDTQHANEPLGMMDNGKERWARYATLRAHVQDVLDLAWSRDGTRLVSASVDNAIMIWDVKNPSKSPVTLRNHANFVQGVSIDPFSRLIASLGNDRTMRVFTSSNATNWYQVAYLSNVYDTKLFMDDARFKNCFRRLGWSPDGSVVACPSGVHLPATKRQFAVHVFARNQWMQPAAQCGGLIKPAVAVRFSPILYELRYYPQPSTENQSEPSSRPFAKFTYRMVFAVLCVDQVLFYDTQNFQRPFASVKGLHVAENTDLTWSGDGRTVAVSSADGYVALICFTAEELGQKLSIQNTPPWLYKHEDISPATRSPSKTAHPTTVTVVRPLPSRALEKASMKTASSPETSSAPLGLSSTAGVQSSAHPKPLVPTVSPPQLPREPASIATKSTTTAQGYRIGLANPAENILRCPKSVADTPVVDLTSLPDEDPSRKQPSKEAAENESRCRPTPEHQPSKTSADPVKQPTCSTPTMSARDLELQESSKDIKPSIEAEVCVTQSIKEGCTTPSTGDFKEQPKALADATEDKTVRTIIVDNADKEISADPESAVRVVNRNKSAYRGTSPQASKRRLKTKQVQTTLRGFQTPNSTTNVPKPKLANEGANNTGVTGPMALDLKRMRSERPDQNSATTSPSDANIDLTIDEKEQRKRRKLNPAEVVEIS
ncbi:Nucleosome/chromatin assembly complex protein [Gracilaria domingensis]|nr:Nucleosome/chromatin assembly complex protein [Gracilaria domingensis]